MLVFLAVNGLAQNGSNKYYYYYQSEKKYLELNLDFAFVSVVGNEAENADLFKVGSGVFKKEGLSDEMKQKLNLSDDFYWTEIKFGENITSIIYNEKVTALKQNKNVEIVSPYFKSANSKKIGLTNFFYVKLKTTTDIALLNQYAKQTKSIIVKQDVFMPLWYVLSCTKASENAMELANKFFESGLFQYAEPDLMLEDILNCVNDTYFPQQWGLRNTGQYGGNAGTDIRACDAWNLSTGSNVNVAVIDHGIQLDHPDLQANIHSLSYDTENSTSPSVVRGDHGTACAGIIGAVGNTAGIRGIAPNCRLMSISNTLNSGTPNIKQKLANGINWSVQNGAHVISNSWGSNDLTSSYIDDAITNAITNGRNGLGCVVVFATGNNNGAVIYPANSNPNIIAVGAISPCGQRKSTTSCDTEINWGSNFGATLDVVAPGVLIPTTDLTGTNGYNPNWALHTLSGGTLVTTDYTNNDYTVWFNGTSSACPHVAGVAALVLSANPSLTGQQVRDIIEQTAQKVGGYNYTTTTGRTNGTWHNEMGYGLVNALCAVQNALARLASISGSSTVCSSGATFTLNNLPDSASVSWDKSFNLAYVSGQGTTSYKVKSSGGILPTVAMASGEDLSAMSSMAIQSVGSSGWVRATISSSCGDIPLEKTVWAGLPGFIPVVSGYPTVTCGNSLFTEANNRTVTWSVGGSLQLVGSNYGPRCVVRGTENGVGWVYATAANDCGSLRGELLVEVSCGYSLVFSPNPSSGETTIEIATGSGEVLAPDTEWDLEVYDSMQSLKTKTQKLKGDKKAINTTGWKDGLYIVRVKIGNEIISEKLVVKH